MHHARVVRGFERVGDGDGHVDRLAPLHRAGAADAVVQRLAAEQLHGEEDPPVERAAEVVQMHEIGMRERGDRARFTTEALDGVGGAGVTGGEHLHRRLAPELHVLGRVDRAAGALADDVEEPVRRPGEHLRIGKARLPCRLHRARRGGVEPTSRRIEILARASLSRRANSLRARAGSPGHSFCIRLLTRPRTPRSPLVVLGACVSTFCEIRRRRRGAAVAIVGIVGGQHGDDDVELRRRQTERRQLRHRQLPDAAFSRCCWASPA